MRDSKEKKIVEGKFNKDVIDMGNNFIREYEQLQLLTNIH
jgi:hypothetical protein